MIKESPELGIIDNIVLLRLTRGCCLSHQEAAVNQGESHE